MKTLDLHGLDLAPAQAWGSVRLVPLIRRRVREDLRLARRRYDEDLAVVSLDGGILDAGIKYVSFVPHGLVASWSNDGSAAASLGGAMAARAAKTGAAPLEQQMSLSPGLRAAGGRGSGSPKAAWRPGRGRIATAPEEPHHAKDGKAFGRVARVLHRMVKREDDRSLRFLPLHLAMEGLLALCFGGPDVAWPEWSRRALARGLDPREEQSISGAALPGFADALRVFEIHERQCGVLVFVADALASAFVVPHPDDYRALHRSLLEDFYGELLYRYGGLHPEATFAEATIDASSVASLADLRAALAGVRRDWADFGALLASSALGRALRSEEVYRLGAFRLCRFTTDLSLHEENHLGEAIVRDDGTTEYLKTYRLSDAQARRAHLLSKLREHGWKLDRTAEALGTTPLDLVQRLDRAGFAHLIVPALVAAARA